MADRFVPFDRHNLLPPCIEDYVPEDHLARFVVDIVEQLDLGAITGRNGSRGGSEAWHPAMLVALLMYGYATGKFSSRKLERATYESVVYQFICRTR
jgi:transposase